MPCVRLAPPPKEGGRGRDDDGTRLDVYLTVRGGCTLSGGERNAPMSPWFSPPKANALPDGTPEAPRPPSDDALCVIVARPKNKPTITVRQISGQMFDAISLPECVQNELWTACKRRRVSAAFSGKPKAALITVFWQRNAAFELGGSSLPGRGIALADWGGRRLEAVQRASRWRSRMHLALSIARGDIMLVHMQAGGNALQRLGVQLSSSNTICAVLPNSPAERAGLQRGDQVEALPCFISRGEGVARSRLRCA